MLLASFVGMVRHTTALVRNIGAAYALLLNVARTHAPQRWRQTACGTNAFSSATVAGGNANTASGM